MSTNASIRSGSPRSIPTDEELMELPKDGYKRELLNGEIVMSPAGSEHGMIIMQFAVVFGGFIYQHGLGQVFDGQTGFRMKSLDVLSPDISFVARERLLAVGGVPAGFFEGAPDLAIEFLSQSESKLRMKQKPTQYLENETKLAWVIDSQRRVIQIHREVEPYTTLSEAETLTGESVVPGFQIAVSAVFAGML